MCYHQNIELEHFFYKKKKKKLILMFLLVKIILIETDTIWKETW